MLSRYTSLQCCKFKFPFNSWNVLHKRVGKQEINNTLLSRHVKWIGQAKVKINLTMFSIRLLNWMASLPRKEILFHSLHHEGWTEGIKLNGNEKQHEVERKKREALFKFGGSEKNVQWLRAAVGSFVERYWCEALMVERQSSTLFFLKKENLGYQTFKTPRK